MPRARRARQEADQAEDSETQEGGGITQDSGDTKGAAELPTDLKDAFKLLHEAEAMPEVTQAQQRAKNAALARIRPHVFQLQQGPPVIATSGDFLAQDHARGADDRRRVRLDQMAITDVDVRWLLGEYDSIRAQLNKINAG